MAYFRPDTIRGDGLWKAHGALATLASDSAQLDRERQRFDHTPSPVPSKSPGTSTLTNSPNAPTKEERIREKRRKQMHRNWNATIPERQFRAQVDVESLRMFHAANPEHKFLDKIHAVAYADKARKIVKKRWVEQGIWNRHFNWNAWGADWKHTEPLEPETDSEADSEANSPSTPPLCLNPKHTRREPTSRNEKLLAAARQIVQESEIMREREREASRPYHQFVYQVSKEREKIQEDSQDWTSPDVVDINTKAYENVKTLWNERKIWNVHWGTLPGMSWKHEVPFNMEAVDNPAHEDYISIPSTSTPSPVAQYVDMFPGSSTDRSMPPSPRHFFSVQPMNGDAALSTSPGPQKSEQDLRSMTGQTSQQIRKNPSPEDGQAQPEASMSLSPSKVSKATRKKGTGPRRRPDAMTEPPADTPGLLGWNMAESSLQPACAPPRRSKRIQSPKPGVTPASTVITSTDLLRGTPGVRSKRKAAGKPKSMGSAKSQGISKKLHPNRAQAKGQKG